jgi:phosphohistidine phosphatase
MKLYLVRHGEPKPESEDPERPLSDKGREEIERLAVFIKDRFNICIQSIQHSGKLRAEQTAEILAQALVPAEGLKQSDGLNPLDDPSIWADRLSTMDEDVMLVGHLPYLSRLVSDLITRDAEKKIVDFATGGFVYLSRNPAGQWAIQEIIDPDHIP